MAVGSVGKGVVVPEVGLESPIIPIAGDDKAAFSASPSADRLALSLSAFLLLLLTATPPGVTGAGDSTRPFRFSSSFVGPAIASSGIGVRESRSKGETKSNMVFAGAGEAMIGGEDFSTAETLTSEVDSPLRDAAISSRDCRGVATGGKSELGEEESICVGDINLASNAAEAVAAVVLGIDGMGEAVPRVGAVAAGAGERAGGVDGDVGLSSDCCSKASSDSTGAGVATSGVTGVAIAAAAGAFEVGFVLNSRSRSLGAAGAAALVSALVSLRRIDKS